MNIGIVLGVSEAIASTDFNDIETIVIWQGFDGEGLRHRIECAVWEYDGDPADLEDEDRLDDAVDLRPYGGRCHSFQYRVEAVAADDPDDADLLEADEDYCPSCLVRWVPQAMRDDACATVKEWLTSEYPSRARVEEDA